MSFSNQVWSTGIRVAALGGKSVLMLLLAKDLEVDAYGAFGLVAVTISFAVYLLGFEFYTHSVRSIVGENIQHRECLIRDHLIFILLGYALWLPALYVVVIMDFVPAQLAAQFYVLLVFEHISTELYRLLVALKRPVSASICFFIRNASWGYVLIVIILSGLSSLDVKVVLDYWIIGAGLSIIYGVGRLGLQWGRLFDKGVDWSWIRRGAYVGAGFLAGTLLLRATGIADRYLIHFYLGDYAVGIYTLYVSLVGVVSTFFESGLLMHAFPGILEAHNDGNKKLYRERLQKFLFQSIWVSLVLITGAYILFQILLMFDVVKSEYSEESTCFIIMLVGVLIKNMAFTPHYGLYVNGQDSRILASSVIGFIVAVALCAYLIPIMGITGAAVSIVIANLAILVTKAKFYLGYQKLQEAGHGS